MTKLTLYCNGNHKDDNGNPIFWLADPHNQSSGHFLKHPTNSNPGSCL